MNRQLFVCNSVYQVLVAMWIKYIYHQREVSDLIISDHMNGAKTLTENIKKTGIFDQVYYVESVHLQDIRFYLIENREL